MSLFPTPSPTLARTSVLLLSVLVAACSGEVETALQAPPTSAPVAEASPAAAPEPTPEPTPEVITEDAPTDLPATVAARPQSDAMKAVIGGLTEAARSRRNPFTGQAEDSGAADYALLCSSCHGSKAQGGGPASVVLGGTATNLLLSVSGESLSDGERFGLVKGGIPGTHMQGFGTARSDAQLWKILAYVDSLR